MDFDPQAFIAQNAAPQTNTIGENFDPKDFINQNIVQKQQALQTRYGTGSQQALAGVEAFGRGASLGTSDLLETKLLGIAPEDIRGREEANPVTSFLGSGVGGGALIAGTGGFGGLAAGVEGAVGKGLLGRALGVGAEGAIFGGGNAVSDAALGDPNLNAEKILGHIGTGFATGAALGTLGYGLGKLFGVKNIPKEPGAEEAPTRGGRPELSSLTPGQSETPPSLEQVTELNDAMPKNLADMKSATEDAINYGGETKALPQHPDAVAAAARLNPSLGKFGINELQLDALSSPDAWNDYARTLQFPGENGTTLRNFSSVQKNKLLGVLDHTIEKGIAPGYEPTSNALEAGERVTDSFTKVIENTRKELGPAFQEIKSTPLADMDHLPGVIDYLTDPQASPYANPKIANMFDTSGDTIEIKPYKTSMGLDKATYTAIKQAVTSLEDQPKDFENLFDIRKGLTQNVDVSKLGDASKEISSAKAAMMDYIQDSVQSVNADSGVRDAFKRWAINEQNAQMIERKFGAEIGSDNWRSLAKGGDEGILNKIFRDTETVRAAKEILAPEAFNKMLADHLSILRDKATDQGVFSSRKFATALKKSEYVLGDALSDNPQALAKIQDAATLMKMFPDSIPANPSKSAQTLMETLMEGGFNPVKQMHGLLKFAKDKIGEEAQAQAINAKLSGNQARAGSLNSIKNILDKINKNSEKLVDSIFNGNPIKRGAILSGSTYLSDKEYDDVVNNVKGLLGNPEYMMDDLAMNTQHSMHVAPNITQGIHAGVMRAAQFLGSKIPQQQAQYPLGPKWEPTKEQKSTFNQYYQAVEKPEVALEQIKNGTLNNKTMEALHVVHPNNLQDMRMKVITSMSQISPEELNRLTYSQRMSLSKFLNQPLDANMTPQGVFSNQASFSAPKLSTQTGAATGKRAPALGALKQLDFPARTGTQTARQKEE